MPKFSMNGKLISWVYPSEISQSNTIGNAKDGPFRVRYTREGLFCVQGNVRTGQQQCEAGPIVHPSSFSFTKEVIHAR